MGVGQRRDELRANAQAKLDDARLLLDNKRYSNAYYLAGYAVELGLKACIAAQIPAETIPDKAFIKGILNHQFGGRLGSQGWRVCSMRRRTSTHNSPQIGRWSQNGSRTLRYESKDVTSASLLVHAIADPKSGVLEWIKTHW